MNPRPVWKLDRVYPDDHPSYIMITIYRVSVRSNIGRYDVTNYV